MTRPLTPKNQTLARQSWTWQDGLIILAVVSVIFGIIHTASKFTGTYNPSPVINLSPTSLPGYTARTLLRMLGAYFIALGFSLSYAYLAYTNRLAERLLLPLLDILQSIPVLSFLPGVVLALIGLFPGQQIGLELAAILLIFTGMAWNLTLSFYQSLSSVPAELREVARVYRLSGWHIFWTLDLPSGVIGLIWNSVMSVAGGWFFLIAIESFTLGKRNFTLPGLGSYLGTAANKGDYLALTYGLLVLLGVIVTIDLLLWQPLIAWGEKFKFQLQNSEMAPESPVLDGLRRSPTLRAFNRKVLDPIKSMVDRQFASPPPTSVARRPTTQTWKQWLNRTLFIGLFCVAVWGTGQALWLMRVLSWQDWQQVIVAALYTTLRVLLALILSLLWTVPVGVTIGRNPRLAKLLQPLVQIAASVPATALFPVVLVALANMGGGLQVGSVILMLLGTMWYILFNVIAGAQAIPTELLEAATIYQLSRLQRWRTVILPGIFPYLITGIITAVGGAWNASIVSEYVQFQGQPQDIPGLGATISKASAANNFPLLLAATMTMVVVVVLTNRLVWRRLYRLAQNKYQLL